MFLKPLRNTTNTFLAPHRKAEVAQSNAVSPAPNTTTLPCSEDAAALSRICCEAVSILNSQQTLHLEAAALSRILYRTKVKMRFDKGIMYMSKVNRCLLQYLSMDLVSAYNSLKSSDEDEFGIVCAPSRQRLEWVLVRTQGFAQLFCHIMKACNNAAYYMMCRMHLGHVWDLALISLALISRIWTLSKYLVLQCCEWYRLLKPYKDILQPVGMTWLPADYEFPEDLVSWLQSPFLTAPVMLRSKKRSIHREIFDLINLDDEDDVVEEHVPIHEDLSKEDIIAERENQMESEKLNSNPLNGMEFSETDFFPQKEDIGELVMSTPSLPSVQESDQSREEPKKKKKRKKNKELGQDGKITESILNTLFTEPVTSTPSLPSILDSDQSREEPKMKKKKRKKNAELGQDGKTTVSILNTLFTEPVTSTPSLPSILDSDQSREEPKMKKKKREKNAELGQDLKHEIFNKTVLFRTDKKRKMKKFEGEMENEISVNSVMHISKNKQKNTEIELEVHDDVCAKTVMKNNKVDLDMEEEILSKTILQPSEKNKRDTDFEWKIQDEVREKKLPFPSSIKQIITFKSVCDLKEFLIKERKNRKKSENCATKCMDKLQWHMFEQAVKGYIQKLTSGDLIEGGSEYRRILKRARKEILTRIQ